MKLPTILTENAEHFHRSQHPSEIGRAPGDDNIAHMVLLLNQQYFIRLPYSAHFYDKSEMIFFGNSSAQQGSRRYDSLARTQQIYSSKLSLSELPELIATHLL